MGYGLFDERRHASPEAAVLRVLRATLEYHFVTSGRISNSQTEHDFLETDTDSRRFAQQVLEFQVIGFVASYVPLN